MITRIPFTALGRFQNEWLNAHYHFSFAQYYDPARMGLWPLRVINDDTVQPGTGFPMHPHQDMEIITYVRQGAISHRDSLGNSGRTEAGEIQIMSAGTGITHTEWNEEDTETTLYQIWIIPEVRGVPPRWEHHHFPTTPVEGGLRLLASGRPADIANQPDVPRIYQHAALWGGVMEAGKSITHGIEYDAYLLVARGEVTVNGQTFSERDGGMIKSTPSITITATTEAELLLIEVRA